MAERTLIIIKPDGIQRQLAGGIIKRFENKGFKLVAAKFVQITEETARRHYAVHAEKPFFEGLVKYLSSSPSLVMVWEADGIVEMARKMMKKAPKAMFLAIIGIVVYMAFRFQLRFLRGLKRSWKTTLWSN